MVHVCAYIGGVGQFSRTIPPPVLGRTFPPDNSLHILCIGPTYISMYPYTHIHTYTHTYTHIHTHIHIHTYTYIYMHTYTCIHIPTYIYRHTYICIWMYVCEYTMYVCM